MGSKSSGNVQAPDPRLIDAQIKSIGIQDEAIQRMLGTADRSATLAERVQENAERFLPLQQDAMQFGLDSMRRAAAESAADREWALGRRGALQGMQDVLISDAKAFNTDQRRAELAGEASADVAKAFETARANAGRELVSMGWQPGGGRFGSMVKQLANDEALARAAGSTQARKDARAEGYALTDRATNALAGYPAMGMQASGAMAGHGAGGLGVVNQGVGGMQAALQGGAGAMQGAQAGYGQIAASAGGMGGNASNAYGTQANAYNQAQSNRFDFGQVLGAGLGGWAAGGFKFSDRRLKRDIERVGATPGGHALYHFRYLWGGPAHVGVMADEVAHVPGAVSLVGGFAMVDYSKIT